MGAAALVEVPLERQKLEGDRLERLVVVHTVGAAPEGILGEEGVPEPAQDGRVLQRVDEVVRLGFWGWSSMQGSREPDHPKRRARSAPWLTRMRTCTRMPVHEFDSARA